MAGGLAITMVHLFPSLLAISGTCMAPSFISLYSTQVEALHTARVLPIVQLKNRVLSGQLVYLVLECAYYTSHSCL